jgi:hypothetical protein
LLAAKSTPSAVIDLVTTKAANGEIIPTDDVRELISKVTKEMREERERNRRSESRSKAGRNRHSLRRQRREKRLERERQLGEQRRLERDCAAADAADQLIDALGLEGARLVYDMLTSHAYTEWQFRLAIKKALDLVTQETQPIASVGVGGRLAPNLHCSAISQN